MDSNQCSIIMRLIIGFILQASRVPDASNMDAGKYAY